MFSIWKERLIFYGLHLRARMLYALVISWYLCRLFGDSPSLALQTYYAQVRLNELKIAIESIPRPQFNLAFNTNSDSSHPQSESNRNWLGFPIGNNSNTNSGGPLSHQAIPTNGQSQAGAGNQSGSNTSGGGTNTGTNPVPTQTSQQPTSAPFPTSGSTIPTTRPPTAAPTQPPLPPPIACPSSSSESYDSIPIQSAPTQNAASHGDINLAMRSYAATSSTLDLIDVGGDIDPVLPPQLDSVLSSRRRPTFQSVYKVYEWNFNTNTRGGLIGSPDVTLAGLRVNPGESVVVPESGYAIGNGKEVMVLYADSSRVTLKYTREDNVVMGYTVHVEDFCVDPNLVSTYNQLNAAGRGSLPGLQAGEKLGAARTYEIKVAIRDTGAFMDPRVRKDWWQRY